MFHNFNLLVFAVAFVGCVLATPVVTRVAGWLGAIDRPDQFRRIHRGAIPRLGGLGLAFGVALAAVPVLVDLNHPAWPDADSWGPELFAVAIAGALVLLVGVLDDTFGMAPRVKLLGQTAAALVLIGGGIQITKVSILGLPINFSLPLALPVGGRTLVLEPIGLVVTLVWFLGCMNIWNLIDGMDGLASGVGLLVSGTMMLVAIRMGNGGSAALAAALAGGLAGFLLYNWHPACIFLGDSGSLLIGLLLGVIGVRSSMKGTTTVSILFPILAMGLPISDTAMAIFRRWVRELPLSSADRRHIHHLLIGLGLNPRQAAAMLYCFSGFFCGVVLLGVAVNNPVQGEFLALTLGLSGCLAFLVMLTSRRDELASLTHDLKTRFARKRQERDCARLTWESIQRIELRTEPEEIWAILRDTASALGCDHVETACHRDGLLILHRAAGAELTHLPEACLSGTSATFRLKGGEALRVSVTVHHRDGSEVEADIALRSLQRLTLAAAERLERLLSESRAAAAPVRIAVEPPGHATVVGPTPPPAPAHHADGIVRRAIDRGAGVLDLRGRLSGK